VEDSLADAEVFVVTVDGSRVDSSKEVQKLSEPLPHAGSPIRKLHMFVLFVSLELFDGWELGFMGKF
jgi:hypothetical protein